MKYRRNKVKREHGIIQNALPWLENLGRISEVTDIIPGVIDVSHSSERGIVYKYQTQTGCKLLLKSNGSIQEVFVVTKSPTCVEEWVKDQFPLDLSSVDSSIDSVSGSKPKSISRNKLSDLTPKSSSTSEFKTSNRGRGPHRSKRRSKGGLSKSILEDRNVPKIADQLDQDTRKALSDLKKSLENTKPKTEKLPKIEKTAFGKRP